MHQFLYDKKSGESLMPADGLARSVGPVLTDTGQKKPDQLQLCTHYSFVSQSFRKIDVILKFLI